MKFKTLTLNERMHLFVCHFNAHRKDYESELTVEKLKNQSWFGRMEEVLDGWEVAKFAF